MRLPIIALMTTLLLSGCGQVHSKAGNFSVIEYSDKTQEKAAEEMESGKCPTLNTFINDYSVLRDQARGKMYKE